MSEERQRVLRMLKEGKVTVEEAEALLEALGEAEVGEAPAAAAEAVPGPAARPIGVAAAGSDLGRAPETEAGPEQRRGFDLLIDDIMRAVDVEGIVESVRESLRRSGVDMKRVKEEVRRATGRVREETRRAAREYRTHAWGHRVSRAIDGLWGLVPAVGSWSHEADLAPGDRLVVHNAWGDIRVKASADGRLRAAAVTRAWGRDEAEAAALRDAVRIRAIGEGAVFTIGVETPPNAGPRRFRVDFDVHVPAGVTVEMAQARGDVAIAGHDGDASVRVASGDIVIRDLRGSVAVEAARGDISVSGATGNVRVKASHGDVLLSSVGGAASVHLMHGDVAASGIGGALDIHTMHGDIVVSAASGEIHAESKHGDIVLRRPAGPVRLELETARGDISAEVERLVAGTTSRMTAVSGDLSVRLGAQTRCRIAARATSGDVHARAPMIETEAGRRSFQGVYGSAEAALELSTLRGDISISGPGADARTEEASSTASPG